MQISKCLIKRDIQDQEIFAVLNLDDKGRNNKLKSLIENARTINGDLLRLSDYIRIEEELLSEVVNLIKKKYNIIGLKSSISLVFLLFGTGLEKRDKYMKEVGEEWEKVKNTIGLFPYEKYFDYEYNAYEYNINTLKKLEGNSEILELPKNDFVHLQTWITAILLSEFKERGIKFKAVKEGTELTGIKVESRYKDVEDILERLENTYGKIIKLYTGWFIFNE